MDAELKLIDKIEVLESRVEELERLIHELTEKLDRTLLEQKTWNRRSRR